jgi:hypothetical protein
MSTAEFEQALREATTSMQGRGFGPRTALIPDLGRALPARVERDEFDQGLRRLREEGSVGSPGQGRDRTGLADPSTEGLSPHLRDSCALCAQNWRVSSHTGSATSA